MRVFGFADVVNSTGTRGLQRTPHIYYISINHNNIQPHKKNSESYSIQTPTYLDFFRQLGSDRVTSVDVSKPDRKITCLT